jgi:hypothetical protein
MLLSIITHTPLWVWGLLIVLIAFGMAQRLPRRVGPVRATAVPIVLAAWSFAGVLSRPTHADLALAAWAICALAVFAAIQRRAAPAGSRWVADQAQFEIPGSAVPLAAMVGLFAARYFGGASQAIAPALAGQTAFIVATAAVYGSFAGLFLGRAARLWRLAGAHSKPGNIAEA